MRITTAVWSGASSLYNQMESAFHTVLSGQYSCNHRSPWWMEATTIRIIRQKLRSSKSFFGILAKITSQYSAFFISHFTRPFRRFIPHFNSAKYRSSKFRIPHFTHTPLRQVSAPVVTSQCINLQHVDWNRGINTYCRIQTVVVSTVVTVFTSM